MQGVSHMALPILFWVLLCFACLGFVEFGVITFFVIVAALIALVLIRRHNTDVLGEALNSLAEGARHALPVAVACALVGVIIGIINLTGAAAEFGGQVISIGRDNLFLALFLKIGRASCSVRYVECRVYVEC